MHVFHVDTLQEFSYNEHGGVVCSVLRHADAQTPQIVSGTAYQHNGNHILSQTDARGKTVTHDIDENTDQEAAFAEPEDAMEWLRGLFEEETEQNEVPFDPYFKIQRTSETTKRSSVYRDENGNLHCWNISAYQIPSISLTEEISGTIYTVTGSFEGSQNMLRKLERITAQNFPVEMGEDA